MAPLRREWTVIRHELAPAILLGRGVPAERARLAGFQKKIAAVTVLDPACGSGNFLYVALQCLLGLEKEVITAAAQLDWTLAPLVNVQQLRAIELNAYAYELAQVSVQIGFLQWRRDNGFDNDRSPVLQNLDGFENKDALLNETFRKKPKNLQAAQAEEHGGQDELFKVYTERAWPECDVIVGNPPFLGTKKLRSELGDDYVEELFKVFRGRIPNFSDLCCYWFEKARQQIEDKKCRRAGLLATQGIRGGLNREVLNRIKKSGNIFFAESDRPWVLAGANVHVSMAGFDDGTETECQLNGKAVPIIHSNLTSVADTTKAARLVANRAFGFIADVKAGRFDLHEKDAAPMLHEPNPHGRPNSDVLLDGPWARFIDRSTIQNQKSQIGTVRYPRIEPRDAGSAAKLKNRTLTNLYNERPAWLDMAHKKLDAAVAAAYGFPSDLTDDEILSRLLALNLERAAEEAAAQPKPKAQRSKAVEEML